MAIPADVPVVVVGGGEVGLAMSVLLSLQGIGHILLERHATTSIVPKAVGLHNRTMEIVRTMGLEDEVHRHGAPLETVQRVAWWTSFGPHGREIASREALGYVLSESERGTAYANASPSQYRNFAQIRFEPILKRRAEGLNPGGVFFGREVSDVKEGDDGAVVTYHDRYGPDQRKKTVACQYVVGADGGRFLTDHLGIGWNGQSDIADMVTAHIKAPITSYLPTPDENLLYWFVNPQLSGSTKSGVLYHLGPYPRDTETEEWTFFVARLPHEMHHPFTKEDMLTRFHGTLQEPALQDKVEVLSISHWFLQAKWAKSFTSPQDRVFLIGDAAHRVPPWGALGANTGIQDADNLVWKLGLVLKSGHQQMRNLLRSYDSERRPIGERVAKGALGNLQAHTGILDRAIGITPESSVEQNVEALSLFLDTTSPAGAKKREDVKKAVDILDIEFYALGAEAGWFYDFSDDCCDDDWKLSPQMNSETGEFEVCEYRPCTIPGHPLPHAWLYNSITSGERVSTRWLVPKNHFLLLASETNWRKVQHAMVEVVIIGENGDDLRDRDGTWEAQREVKVSGAVLVRPDNIVAWRWKDDGSLREERGVEAMINEVVGKFLEK